MLNSSNFRQISISAFFENHKSYQDLLFEDENIDCRKGLVTSGPLPVHGLHADHNAAQSSNDNFHKTGMSHKL